MTTLYTLVARRQNIPSAQWLKIPTVKRGLIRTKPVELAKAEKIAKLWKQGGWDVRGINTTTEEEVSL
jgi:hypothetical protein